MKPCRLDVVFSVGEPAGYIPKPIETTASPSDEKLAETVEEEEDDEQDAIPNLPLVQDGLRQIRGCDWAIAEPCYETILKILGNIAAAPEDAKFKRIPKSSKKICSNVLEVPGALD